MKYNLLKAFIHSIFPGTCEESWVPKNWCFWTVVLEKTLESPLDSKEIQPIHPKRDQSWVFIGRTDDEAETPILWPPHAKSWLIWKNPDAGRDWGQEEKGMTEDEMAGRHHWLDGHGFGWTLGVGDGQGDLVCCGSWGSKESDVTERLNWTELKSGYTHYFLTYSHLLETQENSWQKVAKAHLREMNRLGIIIALCFLNKKHCHALKCVQIP